MKLPVPKNYLLAQILYRIPYPVKKRRLFILGRFFHNYTKFDFFIFHEGYQNYSNNCIFIEIMKIQNRPLTPLKSISMNYTRNGLARTG